MRRRKARGRVTWGSGKAGEGEAGWSEQDSECTTDALTELYSVLAWSFKAMAAGVFPSHDHAGRPFSTGHHPARAATAGKPLAGGFLAAFVEVRGDWKLLREALQLRRHYGTAPEMRHLCCATKHGSRVYTNFAHSADHRGTLTSHSEWLASATAVPPLATIPGFASWSVFFDIMHTLDALGHTAAS